MKNTVGVLCLMAVLLCLPFNATAVEYSSCGDYPDSDLIIMLEESVREVSFIDVLTFASLPGGWRIKAETEVPDEDVMEDIEDKGYISESNYGPTKFDRRYVQLFESVDGSWVLAEIDYFKNADTPRHVLEAHRKVISQAINVGDLRSTGTNYGEEGITCHVAQREYHLYFRSGSRFFMIYGNSSEAVELFGSLYSSQKNPMVVKEKYRWMAKVCKSGSGECTQDIYYSGKYDDVVLKECKVTHGSETTECPEGRIERYGGHIKVPFHSCNKDDVLDLEYEKTTLFPILNQFWSPMDFYFNSTRPTDKFSLKLVVPPDAKVIQRSPEGLLNQYSGGGGKVFYVWERARVPPYKTEAYMPSTRKVVDRVTYTSMDSWRVVEEWFNGLFKGSLNASAVAGKTHAITANASDRGNKSRLLYEWVRDNVRYESLEFGFMSGYQPNPASEVLSYRFGDCKDHTVLLLSMLQSAGIEAYPVLVSRPSFDVDIPSPYEFYHSIVAVPEGGGYVWLDPTCGFCPYGYVNPVIQGSQAMILLDSKQGFTVIDELDADKLQVTEINETILLMGDGTAMVNYTLMETGYPAVADADELVKPELDSVRNALKDYINAVCDAGELKSYSIDDSKTDVGILTIRLAIQCRNFASMSGEKILFDLSREPMFYSVIREDRRVFPIELDDSMKVESNTVIVLPDGYSVESIPEDFRVSEDFAEYESKFSSNAGTLYYYSKAMVKAGEIPASRFPAFKKFFLDISSNSRKGVILSPSGRVSAGDSVTTTTEVAAVISTTTTAPEEESKGVQACSPALPAVLVLSFSALAGFVKNSFPLT